MAEGGVERRGIRRAIACLDLCAASRSTVEVPATLEAASKPESWCEIGLGEVGPYRNVDMITD